MTNAQMTTVTVKDGQTLFDIAVQSLGSVDRVFDLAQLNGVGINDALASGQVLLLPTVDFEQTDVVNTFADTWYPAGGDVSADNILGGIGFMQIGTNFKVS